MFPEYLRCPRIRESENIGSSFLPCTARLAAPVHSKRLFTYENFRRSIFVNADAQVVLAMDRGNRFPPDLSR